MSDPELLDVLAQAPRGQVAVLLLMLFIRWQVGRSAPSLPLPWLLTGVAAGVATFAVTAILFVLALSAGLAALAAGVSWETAVGRPDLWTLWGDDRMQTVWTLALEMLVAVLLLRLLADRWARLAAVLAAPAPD